MSKESKTKVVGTFDYRGVTCPLNFVKTKIELEKIKVDQVIAIRIDEGEPMKNVPRSVKMDGHEILRDDEHDDGSHTLTIRKK